MAAVVHECLFCPQTFNSAESKDDHVLQHFAQETCTDCDQKLIRIGRHLFTLHDNTTCIKRTPKVKVDIASQNAIKHKDLDELSINSHGFTEVNIRGNNLQDGFRDSVNPNDLQIKEESVEQTGEYITPIDVNQIITSKAKTGVSCDICGKVLSCKSSLNKHKTLSHSSPDAIFCNVCGRLFSDIEGRDIHRSECALKSKTRMLKKSQDEICCKMCEKEFRTDASLRKHMKLKHDPSAIIFKCGLCSAIFQTEFGFRRHQQKHERGEFKTGPTAVACDVCGKDLASKDTLRMHKILLHSPPDRIFCRYCGRLFKDVEKRDTHRTECAEKNRILQRSLKKRGKPRKPQKKKVPASCQICDKRLCSKDSLKMHIVFKHSPPGTNFCRNCAKVFSNVNDKDIHEVECLSKKASRNVRTTCEICGRVIASSIKRHKILMHSPPGTILCKKCGKIFPTNADHEAHLEDCSMRKKKVRQNRKQKCEFCDAKFTSIKRMKDHIQKDHA